MPLRQLTAAVILGLLFSALIVLERTSMQAQEGPAGQISGSITASGAPAPGVLVTATNGRRRRTAVTSAQGRYQIADVPEGIYTITAEASGRETEVHEGVTVAPSTTTTLDFVLRVGCVSEMLYVDPGLPFALERADAIVHLRILKSERAARWTVGTTCTIATEHVATVVSVIKLLPGWPPTMQMRFLQEGAGDLPGERNLSTEAPYAPGQEYLAFLQWDPRISRFRRVSGPQFMFAVQEGRVNWTRSDAPKLKDRMREADVRLELGSMLTGGRPGRRE